MSLQPNSKVYTRLSWKKTNVQGPISLSNPVSIYNYTTTSRVSNLGNRAITEKINLHINHKTADYINSFRGYVVNDSMVSNGTVSYCFHHFNDEVTYGINNINRYSTREDYHYTECIEKSWFSIEKSIPNYLLTGWRSFDVKHSVEIEVSPSQTYKARMDVEVVKVRVPYNAVLYLQALVFKEESSKEEYLVDSYIVNLASTIFGSNAVISQVDQITAQVEIVGEIEHEVLKDVYISMLE